MSNQQSVWKANLNSGIILGLIYTIYTMVFYYLDFFFKPFRSFIWMPIIIVMIFILMKQFRDNHRNGFASYGQVLGAGVVISIYYAVIAGVVTYVLYGLIDEGLIAKTLAFQEGMLVERGAPEAQVEMTMKIYEKVFTPEIMPFIQIVNSILGGTIISLIVALFVRKEGNPLID